MAAAAMMPRSVETFLRPDSLPGVSFIGFLQDECVKQLIVNYSMGEIGCWRSSATSPNLKLGRACRMVGRQWIGDRFTPQVALRLNPRHFSARQSRTRGVRQILR